MKELMITLLSAVLFLGCQAVPTSSGLGAQVGKHCMVDLGDSGRDGTLVNATDTWIVLRRSDGSEEWLPTYNIKFISFRERPGEEVTRR